MLRPLLWCLRVGQGGPGRRPGMGDLPPGPGLGRLYRNTDYIS